MDANLQLLLAPTPNWRLATIIVATFVNVPEQAQGRLSGMAAQCAAA
jgi:hypothetical protein